MMQKQKHLDLSARSTIETELNHLSSFKKIAAILGKNCSTIAREVRKHRRPDQSGSFGRGFNDCSLAFSRSCDLRHVCNRCTFGKRRCWSCGHCRNHCNRYQKYFCPKLDKPPYVCNGCPQRQHCSLEKFFYRASSAHSEYQTLRSESRSGFAVSQAELNHLNDIITPLVRRGQSIHHIYTSHLDELMKSERSLYTYINNGLLDVKNLDMPRTVRMRPRKPRPRALKIDKACRVGRTYSDYTAFLMEHPELPVRQLDSVEGIKGGSVLLTIHFVQQSLQLAFLRKSNDSQSVIDIFERLYLELRPDIFMNVFPVLLADNGSEFSNPKAIEFDRQGNRRTHLFYCNPNSPYQKGSCENNHEMIRRCIPKGTDLGQYSQKQIDEMMSHINSYARISLGDKSPYDVFAFQYGEKILNAFGLRRIPSHEITLSPMLFQ